MFGIRKCALAAAVAAAFGTGVAQAQIAIGPGPDTVKYFDSIGTSITCKDGDLCDTNGLAGVISFGFSLDGWVVVTTVDFTKPFIGNPNEPFMDVSFNVAYNTAVAKPGDTTLTIQFSDVDFALSPGSFTGSTDGNFQGGITGITASDYAGPTNTLFDTGVQMCTGTDTTTPVSIPCAGSYNGTTPYSLTQEIVITSNGQNGQASGDDNLHSNPEPGTLALLGVALAGLGFAGRRKDRQ